MQKVFLCLLIATVYTAFAVPVEPVEKVDQVEQVEQVEEGEERFEYPRFIEFPDGDGNPHLIDLQDEIDTVLLDAIARDPGNNRYYLYTRRNPHSSQLIEIHNDNSLRNSYFNANWPTVVVAHGWLSNEESGLNPRIRDAYLGRGDTNVIILDWRRLAIANYITAANGVPAVGRGLGQFLAFVNRVTGARFDNMHIVGFSLGAHLVGNAGRELGGRVARVTGLDPAGPLWVYNNDRLNPYDANYVEAIHTDGGYTVGGLGIGRNVARADFYPNGGISQPGCLTNICNHNNAWRYFASTVSHNHLIANRCESNLQITFNNCDGPRFPMGNSDLRKWGYGMYRVDTGRNYPY